MTIHTPLVVIDADTADRILRELAALHDKLDRLDVKPKPEWLSINDYAQHIGCHRKTVIRRIEAGRIEAKHVGGVRMVKVS
jgi:hypothetical protein